MLESDLNTFKKIAIGDQDTFDDLFRTYYKYLVTIAYSYTKDFDISKDLAQEVFLDIWKRRKTIIINTSIRAFLKRAVINQSLTAIRKNKYNIEISNEALDIQSNADSHVNIEMNELNLKIQSIVDDMPEKYRAVFKLSRYEHLSHKEIAVSLGISLKTIENQITKALKMIRKDLKEDHFISWLVISIFLKNGSLMAIFLIS